MVRGGRGTCLKLDLVTRDGLPSVSDKGEVWMGMVVRPLSSMMGSIRGGSIRRGGGVFVQKVWGGGVPSKLVCYGT